MGPQSHGSPNIGNFGRVPSGSLGTKCHLDVGPVGSHKVYYKGEGGGFPQVRAMVNLVSPSRPRLVLAPKVLQLCTNHLVLVLCKPVWVSEACQFFLVPPRSFSTPLYPSKVLWVKECASTPCSFVIFSLDWHLNPLRSLGARHKYRLQVFLLRYMQMYNYNKLDHLVESVGPRPWQIRKIVSNEEMSEPTGTKELH